VGLRARLGRTFWDWGIPTPDCIMSVRDALPDVPLVATGGLRSGLDAARALALGADVAGFAGHMFRAAAESAARAQEELGAILEELRTACFLAGAATPSRLASALPASFP